MTVQEDFEWFHENNPEVYRRLVALVRQAQLKGYKRVGIKHLFEVLRWEMKVDTFAPDYRLNNNYTSRYARMLLEHHPEFEGFIEVRELKAA